MELHAASPTGDSRSTFRARILLAIVLLCAVTALAVFLARTEAALKAPSLGPGVALTSGYEEESWFAVWRAAHGQSVYSDPHELPFAASYFNWLFYATYGGITHLFVAQGGDAHIPEIGRGFSILGALTGSLVLLSFLRRLQVSMVLAAGLSIVVFFAGLTGWWSVTVRPDVWALALETAGLVALWELEKKKPILAALAAGLLFYLAWSFKQTFVLGMIAGVLYLSWRRRWSAAIVLVTVTLALWGLTFAAMGPGYREVFRSTAAGSTYSLRVGIANTREMLLKTLPLWVLSLGFLASQSARRKLSTTPAAHSAVILGGICLLVVMPLAFAASCKIGAASNYFFDVPVALTLMAGGFLSGESFKRLENRETWIASAAFGGAAGIQVLALAGVMGTVSMAEQTRTQAAIWKVWKSQPEPRFSDLTSLNLPWLNASSPPIVRAFNYARERELGQAFEHKGVGGLIAEGYFRSLLLPSKTGDSYDEASLDGYERGETAQDFTVFHRKGAASPQ